jgi:drug/metabolite transporter (DMT)-like permease
VVDALGVAVHEGGNALQYVAALFLLDGWPFGLLMMARRGGPWPGLRQGHRWPVATGGALASLGSYGIALWAMTRAPVATVAALRETSVLFAALLGTWLLKEAVQRAPPGHLRIVGGVMAIRLACHRSAPVR